MLSFCSIIFALSAIGNGVDVVNGFLLPNQRTTTTTCPKRHHDVTTTSLSMMIPPPMIISPIIKKFQEENAKKKTPMADVGELEGNAPGLKVGGSAWKWPPIWPYDSDFFVTTQESEAKARQQNVNQMASMITGLAAPPTAGVGTDLTTPASSEDKEEEEDEDFDPLRYWGEDQVTAKTTMHPESIQKLKDHYGFYLSPGMSIVEFGAAEESYLPDDINPPRHVGVGGNAKLMEQNPSLTERLVVDLNNVVPDRDIDSDELRKVSQQPVDAVLMANTIEFLTSPREVFRTGWYLLKPGGIMMVAFTGKNAALAKDFVNAKTKMWQDYNDDQHIWMTGSFFHFSADSGWESLYGFDITPDSTKEANPVLNALKGDSPGNLYVVQAVKGYQDDRIDQENLDRSIRSLTWMLTVLESRDKDLLVPRLSRAMETAEDPSRVKAAIEKNIPVLPVIYEQALAKMDRFAFTYTMQAQLAADLICDASFNGNDEQIQALQEGLGLKRPGADFWEPVGTKTAAMDIEDKISLLAYVVPRFGSGVQGQEEALQDFVTGLDPTFSAIRSKCPQWNETDVQLVGTELLAAELLTPQQTSRQEYANWIAATSAEELQELLDYRKTLRSDAVVELAKFRQDRKEQQEQLEEYQKLMGEQVKQAREERSLVFNPRTQKMEIIERPKERNFFGLGTEKKEEKKEEKTA